MARVTRGWRERGERERAKRREEKKIKEREKTEGDSGRQAGGDTSSEGSGERAEMSEEGRTKGQRIGGENRHLFFSQRVSRGSKERSSLSLSLPRATPRTTRVPSFYVDAGSRGPVVCARERVREEQLRRATAAGGQGDGWIGEDGRHSNLPWQACLPACPPLACFTCLPTCLLARFARLSTCSLAFWLARLLTRRLFAC